MKTVCMVFAGLLVVLFSVPVFAEEDNGTAELERQVLMKSTQAVYELRKKEMEGQDRLEKEFATEGEKDEEISPTPVPFPVIVVDATGK